MDNMWESLQEECKSCQKCSLWKTRKNVVFGSGSPKAEIMIIGEGPGANEDEQGLPFVGRAGALLTDLLAVIGVSRDDVFIANMVKCRPPENRDPLPSEKDACEEYLQRQIDYIKPKIVVCLGRISAQWFIKEDFRITQEHGQWFEVNGIPTMALFHPAALLRDPHKKPDTFRDLKVLQAKIHEVCEHTPCL